jgi:hypothetical protein
LQAILRGRFSQARLIVSRNWVTYSFNVKISGARSASDALLGWAIPMPRFLLQQQW